MKNFVFGGRLREHKNVCKNMGENVSFRENENFSRNRKLFTKTIPGTKIFCENVRENYYFRKKFRASFCERIFAYFRENGKRVFRFNPRSRTLDLVSSAFPSEGLQIGAASTINPDS
jgi:hypothetical protein